MTFRLVRGEPRYRAPGTAVAAAIVLLTLGTVVAAISEHERGPVVCPFRAVAGLPCPTCGTVRAAGHLLRGEFAAALRANPLTSVTMAVVAPLLLVLWAGNAMGGWAIRIHARPGERKAAWALAALILVANWVYVLANGT